MLEKIYIAVSSDDNYIVPTTVMLKSVSVNTISGMRFCGINGPGFRKNGMLWELYFQMIDKSVVWMKIPTILSEKIQK